MEPTNETPNDAIGRALGALDHLLDRFHDTVLRPLTLIGRTVAFGFVALLAGVIVIICTLVLLVRLFDVYAFGSHQWATYLVLGAALWIFGVVIWRQRRPVRLRK